MPTIWGYPLKATVEVHGEEVDISDAFIFDPQARSGIVRLDEDKVLDIIDEHSTVVFTAEVHVTKALLSDDVPRSTVANLVAEDAARTMRKTVEEWPG